MDSRISEYRNHEGLHKKNVTLLTSRSKILNNNKDF